MGVPSHSREVDTIELRRQIDGYYPDRARYPSMHEEGESLVQRPARFVTPSSETCR